MKISDEFGYAALFMDNVGNRFGLWSAWADWHQGNKEASSMLDQGEIRRQEYLGRMNRVMDYIRNNLTGDLRLETLARVANFSPFHFHRLFTTMVGETVNAYIRRTRMQWAASQLIYNPKKTITRIAVDCGFSSPSSFARDFRQHFGMSASQFRAGGQDSVAKVREALAQEGAEFYPPHVSSSEQTPMTYSVEVKTMPEFQVAYLSVIKGPTT